MFCINCGNRLPDGARFCSMCGTRVELPVELAEDVNVPDSQVTKQEKPEVIVDEAAVARAEAKATASVPPVSREIPTTQPAAPVRTRIAFDWSNVKDEPQKKQIPNVKSPWDETGGFDEEALYKEMTPSTDRSRTMNFIDVLKAEREEEKKKVSSASKSDFSRDAEIIKKFSEETSSKEINGDEPPRLHFAPLYEDFDTPVKTPFDEPDKTEAVQSETTETEQPEPEQVSEYNEESASEPASPEYAAPVRKEADIFKETGIETEEKEKVAAAEKPAGVTRDTRPSWHWFEMPDFLKKSGTGKSSETIEETAPEPVSSAASASSVPDFRFKTLESALFEEPKYEDAVEPAASPEPETPEETEADEATVELYVEPEVDFSEYESLGGYAEHEEPEDDTVFEPEAISEPAAEPEPEPISVAEPEPVSEPKPEPEYIPEFAQDIKPLKLTQVETEPAKKPENDIFAEPYTYIYPEVKTEPDAGTSADTEIDTETYSGSFTEPESDYYDYINLDMSRSASDGETVGRAASHISEEMFSAEPAVVSEPEFAPETEFAPEPEAVPEPEQVVEAESAPEPQPAPLDEAESLIFDDTPSLENDLADILAAGEYNRSAAAEEATEETVIQDAQPEETEAVPVDENELFAEITNSSPKKTGMTIAAPAEQVSEIESLKRRLAELTGAPSAEEAAGSEMPAFDEPAEPELVIPETASFEAMSLEAIAADEGADSLRINSAEQAEADAYEEEPVSFITPEAEAAVLEQSESEAAPVDDTIQAFEDELSQFLSDVSEPDDTTPVYGLTPYSEFEEADAEETAVEAEPEVITLTGPESDDLVAVPEEISELQPMSEASQESGPVTLDLSDISGISGDEYEAADNVQNAAAHEAEPVVMPVVEPFTAAEEANSGEAQQTTDALSLEDLETDLFGETPSPDAEAEVTKKIDKFYTLYRKNEEFQRLLDEEYSKLKTESHPAAVESSKPAAAGATAPAAREVEDVTIYQELTPEEKKALAEAEAAQAAKAEVEAAVAAIAPQPAEVKAPPVEWDQVAAEEKAAGKKETRKEKKERKKREQEEIRAREAAAAAAVSEFDYDDAEQGSAFLTVVAVIIAILLVILLAIILVLNFAPDSSIALQIDAVIENITSHFSAVDNTGGQYLL